jgi:diguanylate cyclase (GGDEF)-like protein/PAS domain S-box-containing protein
MLGYSREELVGQSADKIINIQKDNDLSGRQRGQESDLPLEIDYKALVAKASLGLRNERELAYRHKDGSFLPVHLTITPLKDDTGKVNGFLEVAYDITERKRTEAHILHMAHHDSLTGLPNRVLLMDRIEMGIKRALRSNNHVGVLMIDLDHFKRVNDSLGHHIGDNLLKAVSERILACVRGVDTVARMGGDEFVVILPDLADAVSAEKVTQKIIDAVAAPVVVGMHELTVTPSVGISIYPEDGNDAHSLLKNADAAMYWAKSSGRYGYQSFSREMERAASEKMAVEMNLRRALRENELCAYYQPQISIDSGEVVGFEALLRWNDPAGGVIFPDQFIAVAEETGLIVSIGERVLRTACRDAKLLQECAGRPLMMAVNLSARQFRDGNLPQLVQTVLAETGLKPTSLELEITESMLVDSQDEVSERLHTLRNLGVSVAVDDFGTGFSSLSYLTQFPISTLKIDRSFIGKMIGSKSDTAVVQAIVAIAKSMDLKVIAEGVETVEQLKYLLEHISKNEGRSLDPEATNADSFQVQGYLINEALPLSWIEKDFQNIRRRSKALVDSTV